MNLKDMLNDVLQQSGFLARDSFTSSLDIDSQQMVAIANRVANEIMNFYPWGGLRKKGAFVMIETIPGIVDTDYPLPSDFQTISGDSMWEHEGSGPVDFPVDNAAWHGVTFSGRGNGGTYRARRFGDVIRFIDPSVGDQIDYEYTTKYPVLREDDVPKERFTLDTDKFLLGDSLLILGVQAHWAQTKLLPQYEEWFKNYSAKVNEAIGRDAGSKTIGGVQRAMSQAPYTNLYLPSTS
jgi:hypothetical protein